MRSADLVVLDTHAWLWLEAAPERLSRIARAAVEHARRIRVPSICLWEVAMLAERGRIALDRPVDAWLAQALAGERVELAEITPGVAASAAALGHEGFHGDPADRLVYATARTARASLVTRDERMRGFDVDAQRLVVW
jgi:PIN domain nuclease of toxin-antitoxin system